MQLVERDRAVGDRKGGGGGGGGTRTADPRAWKTRVG
jgi:hypothetical protein